MACVFLDLQPQGHHALEILDDLRSAQLAFAVQAVHESNGALSHLVAHGLGTHHHLHLETVSLALSAGDDLLQDGLLVQTETAGQVTDTGHEHHVRDQVGRTRGELAEQIPAIDTALAISNVGVSGTGDNVGVGLLLNADHLGDELGVVAEIGVHDDNVVAGAVNKTVDVGGSKTELALAGLQVDVLGAVELLELLSDFEGAVRGAIVDNNDLPVQFTTRIPLLVVYFNIRLDFKRILLGKSPLDQPNDDREVLALVVGRQDDRVLVIGGSHVVLEVFRAQLMALGK